MEIKPEQKYHELIVKLISENRSLEREIQDLEKNLNQLKKRFFHRQSLMRYLKHRIQPPEIQNPYGLEPGKTFSCCNHYGNCIVVVTGIVQKYSCGQWHELFEYQVTCKSHDGLDTYINFGAAAHLGFLNAQYFLDIFSKEF